MKKTALKPDILLIAVLSFLMFNSCQKDEILQGQGEVQLKSGTAEQSNVATYWGLETFTRAEGKTAIVKMKIGSEDLQHFEDDFILKIKNGNDDGTQRVSSAIIKLDGKEIFITKDFSLKVNYLEKEIYGLKETSEIEVELRSEVGSFIDVWIEGYLKPGTNYVDANGGSVTSDDGLLSMSIPPNAVSEKTFLSATITNINLPTDIPGEIKGPVYLFEPSGIEFESPITVILNYTPELFNIANNIRIIHWRPETGTYDIIVPEVDVNNHQLTFTIEHFSVIGTFELESSFLNINNNYYALSDGILGYSGNFEGHGVYHHGIYLLSPEHNFDFETLESNGTGSVIELEIFNTKDYIENGTYEFSIPEVMNTEKLCDGTDVNADGIVNDADCYKTMPDGGFYISSRLSAYSSNADLNEEQGFEEFDSGTVSITKDGEVYTIIMDCIGKNDDVIKAYYKGQLHYYDFSKERDDTNSFTDSRDGKTYKTVKIGDQWWMAENLAYNSGQGCWAYGNDENNVAIYGRLYNWDVAINACPDGWHLPTTAEWTELENFLKNNGYAWNGETNNEIAQSMAATYGWLSSPVIGSPGNNLVLNNRSSFSGLPGGYGLSPSYCNYMGNNGHWWSASESSSTTAWSRHLLFNSKILGTFAFQKNAGLSVRCVKDK